MGEIKELKKVEQLADRCMKCGFCSFFCPVYQEEKLETSLARGKNFLAKQIIQGRQKFSEEMGEIIGKCLLCKRCVTNCPSKTEIDRVIVAARADMVKEKGLGFVENFIFRKAMANRRTFGRYVRLAKAFQWLLPKTEGNIRHLPDFLRALGRGRNIPALAKKFLRDQVKPVYKPEGTPKMRVGLFMGCAVDFVYPDLGLKLINFLTRHGVEVVVPDDQSCCGAAIYFSGDLETGRMLADRNIKAFNDLHVDYIVTACGTCSSSLKAYQKYLPDTEERQKVYEVFEKKVKDSTEFIIDVLKVPLESFKLKREFEGKRITWHDPCHLIRYQNIKDQPRTILKALKGAIYTEMPNADMCCGMGGSFSIYYYDLSKKMAKKKMDGIAETDAEIVVTACPGCMINLVDNILQNRMPQKVYHLLELLE